MKRYWETFVTVWVGVFLLASPLVVPIVVAWVVMEAGGSDVVAVIAAVASAMLVIPAMIQLLDGE